MRVRLFGAGVLVGVCAGTVALAQSTGTAQNVLFVTDVRPVVDVLVENLKSVGGSLQTGVVAPDQLPANVTAYRTIVVHIEGPLPPTTGRALQAYTKGGGRLVLLHNSVGPNKTPDWMEFVGVKLPAGDIGKGGFRAIPNAPVDLVALSHRNPVIESGVTFTKSVRYKSSSRAREMILPGLSFATTEAFVNQAHTRLKRYLMGVKVTDPRSGVIYMQDAGVWMDQVDQGQLYYFMLGQTAEDLRVKPYVQMIANAVVAQ